jgi:hypothetical protein
MTAENLSHVEKDIPIMNTDTVTTLAGFGTATALLSQINFDRPGWWRQAVVAGFVLILGYFTNHTSRVKITADKAPTKL